MHKKLYRHGLFRSLARGMVVDGKIITTKARSKLIVGELDKLLGLVRDGSLSARRRALARFGNDRALVSQLFTDYGELAKSRKSGYVKMVGMGKRRGDNAEMVSLSWVKVPKKKIKNENTPTKRKRN